MAKRRILMAWLVALTVGAGEPTVDLSSTSAEELGKKLDAVIDGSLGFHESRVLLHSVGRGGRREQMPKLKVIAETQWGPERRELDFYALYSLMLLGEPTEYFLAKGEAFRANFWLAYYSMYVLAYEPTQEIVDRLSAIYDASGRQGMVQNPLGMARYVLDTSQHYAQLTDLEGRFAYLIPHVVTSWRPGGVEYYDHQFGAARPPSVWAKKELLKLSQQSPAAVAAQLRAYTRIKRSPKTEDYFVRRGPEVAQWNEDCRQYILEYVSAETRTEYERLRKAEEQAPKPDAPTPPAP
jgi:hypothetical protein